ncbi:MAG TPA: hypothetical protein VHI55_13750, partial [Gaiellaceae bacterium]|nr:hypothetical protein [Gaiellaceae bacterium]
ASRETVLSSLEPRERATTEKEAELEAHERKLRREAERQAETSKRLDRHASDLAERERALARLGQTLMARRDGEHASEPAKDVEIAFSEGIEALSAAARSIRRPR